MICKECNTFNRSTSTNCSNCGSELIYEFDCPECGATLTLLDVYCNDCGYVLEKTKDLLDKDPYKDEPNDYADTRFNLVEKEKREEADVNTRKYALIFSVTLLGIMITLITVYLSNVGR